MNRCIPLLGGLVLLGLLGTAQGARITDKLLAGFYAEPSTDNQPLKVLPSDTPLEPIQQQDAYTRVRLGDGSEGWVESRFITEEKSKRVMLLELQAKNSQLQEELRAVKKQLADKGNPEAATPEGEESNASLKQQLESAQRAVEELQAKLNEAATQRQAEQATLNQRITELEQALQDAADKPRNNPPSSELEQTHLQLQQRLSQIAALAGEGLNHPPSTAAPDGLKLMPWHLVGGALALLISFIAGMMYRNHRLAKRYGGFRM